ncbi:MAG: hypothetical protein QM844_11735 [Planctomycetota bacterium]|nr:hypothetical protein [Planctomycetota bacterium]
MNPPSEDTLHLVNRLKHEANAVDSPLLAGELRQIAYDYSEWLLGHWQPDEHEIRGYFAERFGLARHYAHQAGDRPPAQAHLAVVEQVLH